jgi:DNA-binding SARP family transcriptional activator
MGPDADDSVEAPMEITNRTLMPDMRARLLQLRLASSDGTAIGDGELDVDIDVESSDPPANAAGLSLYLFGPLRASVDGQVVIGDGFARRKVKALLGYLYLRRDEYISKDELLEALWPEVDDVASASGRLKQTVLVLRHTLEGQPRADSAWQYIVERAGSYFFNTRSAYYSDLENFQAALKRAASDERRGDVVAALDSYQQALKLYRADLLQDFRYEDWAAARASVFRERYVQALEHMARLYGVNREYARAIQLLGRAVREEPLRESSSMELMEWLWRRGDHAEAIRVYLRLKALLEHTLELEPKPEATALFEAIRRDRAVGRTTRPGSLPAAS